MGIIGEAKLIGSQTLILNGVERRVCLGEPDRTFLPHIFTDGVYLGEDPKVHNFTLLDYAQRPSAVQQMRDIQVTDWALMGGGMLLLVRHKMPDNVEVHYLLADVNGKTTQVTYGNLDVVCYIPLTSRFKVLSDTIPGYTSAAEKEVVVDSKRTPVDRRRIPADLWKYYHSSSLLIKKN